MTPRMRADAARNRAKVLVAAELVFAAKGTSASTEEVAKEAGVGIGTVFRHFPTKEALLEAVLVGLLARFAHEAEELTRAADPGEAFFGFFRGIVAQAATKNAVSEALEEAGINAREASAEVGVPLKKALATLVERAQEAGAVRSDVGLAEVMALLSGSSHAAASASGDPQVQARALDIVFDGLRPR
ncbi:TetR/AcrR family transcriptional regulator [Actinomadura barringtoniae]|uniref:TetR/AcrR family transcriptional regulator n=2 Tax=Actinomadura barringtoniae TaxID=1427535 RepID=A0A939T406_9ACTN|nr:TetR/AcrR family transcriptional regulator [Actinomadura barringtoniae]